MTTPAININSQLLIDNSRQLQYGDGRPDAVIGEGQTVSRVRIESRPESVKNPVDVLGWRNPSEYYHHGYYSDLQISGETVFDYDYDPSTMSGFRDVYYDGANWDSSIHTRAPLFPGNLEDRAITKALLQMKNGSPNLAVAFAERKQTAELAEHAAKLTFGKVVDWTRNRPKDWRIVRNGGILRHGIRSFPSSFLEVIYGVLPLKQDVYDACSKVNSLEKDGGHRCTLNASVRSPIEESVLVGCNIGASVYGMKIVQTGFHLAKVRLDYSLSNPFLGTLAQLGITNPALVVWEKIPWSFVIDWFLPVGNYISTWDATLGWDFRAGSVSKVTKCKMSGSVQFGDNNLGATNIVCGDKVQTQDNSFSREIYTSSPLPTVPRFKDPTGYAHFANAIALLAQRLAHIR